MHEYPLLFRDTVRAAVAEEFAAKVMDVSVFLAQIGIGKRILGFNPFFCFYLKRILISFLCFAFFTLLF